MTPLKVSIAAAVASILLLLVVFELIRRRRLRERYALLGIETYPPAVLFAIASFFILAVLLHYSTVVSKLSDQSTILAQRVALLEAELESRTESSSSGSTPTSSDTT